MKLESEKKYFQKSFKAREYLRNYYSELDLAAIKKFVLQKRPDSETARIMIFLAEEAVPSVKDAFGNRKKKLLELGGGPTLYQLFSLAEVVDEIHFSDYVQDNLDEVTKWRQGARGSFNWKPYLQAALMLKKDAVEVSSAEVEKLGALVRKKITKVMRCDIFDKDLGIKDQHYDIINTHFVAESATSSKPAWKRAIANISKKLSPKGLLIMSALVGAKKSYRVLKKQFPAVELHEDEIRRELLKNNFREVRIATMKTEDFENNYQGFAFIIAEKQ